MELYKWSKTAANNNSAVPDGAPEGWTGANVNNWGREQMASIRTHIEDAAYFDPNYQLTAVGTKSLTRVSATQFTILACDATAYFTADRRIRVVGATTDQGFVTSSSFGGPDTTVNVVMDSADVPTAPTQALVLVDAKIRGLAYKKPGSGNGADADTLDTYHAADIYGPAIHAEALVNGSMLVWQRGTGSTSCPVATRTLLADRWFTNPAGAAVTSARTATTPTGAVSPYALLVTGAASVTVVTVAGQRVESYLMPYVKASVTVSALVKNDSGAALVLTLLLGTPNAVDDFTTVVNRLTQALTSIPSGNSQRVSFTVDISAYTNINNGLQVEFQAPSGALDAGGKSITITEIQIDRATTFSFFRFRTLPDELVRCRRYYQKTFPYATTPAQNAGVTDAIYTSAQSSSQLVETIWQVSGMRAAATVTTYNPSAANSQWRNITDTADWGACTATAGSENIRLSGSGGTGGRVVAVHASASAEL